MMNEQQPLPDYIKPGLDIVFVGINPGARSAQVGHHYAGHSNRFWKLLNEAKFLPHEVSYQDDGRLMEWGLGFTNIVSRMTASSGGLGKSDYDVGRVNLVRKIRQYRPRILALLGISLYPIIFPNNSVSLLGSAQRSHRQTVGLLPDRFESASVVLLPNPSGRNAHYSYEDMLNGFCTLRRVQTTLHERDVISSTIK